jgi:hypothetical protein
MSDSERTPQRTARVNSERFDTELAAVWYAANYYYETSYRRDREYIGVVFRESNWKFGLTVRGDGSHSESKVRIGDVPRGTVPTAVWHTHLPASAGNASDAAKLITLILSTFDLGWDEFSGNDTKLSDDASKVSLTRWGHRIPIYLVTATVIKKYRGPHLRERVWSKPAPSRMRQHAAARKASRVEGLGGGGVNQPPPTPHLKKLNF